MSKETTMYYAEDRITLWHTGGRNPCGGRAMAVKPHILDNLSPLMAEDADHNPGTRIRCLSCNEGLDSDQLRLMLSPHRGRYLYRKYLEWVQEEWNQ